MKILIADDHELNRRSLGITLQSLGHTIVEAEDGVQALALLEGEPADVLISDILMPNMDGYRLCVEIRKHARLGTLPVVLSCGTHHSPADRQRAAEFGASAFLERPATSERIAEILSRVALAASHPAGPADLPKDLLVLKQYSAHLIRNIEEKNEELLQKTERLAESEEKFRQMAENMDQVFWMGTADLSQLLYVSPAYERVFGRTEAELYAEPLAWIKAIHPDDRAGAEEDFRSGRHLKGTMDQEYRIVRPDGSVRWIHNRSFPVRNAAGEVYRVTGLAKDITERRDLERKLLMSQKMEAVGRLAGGVAHDFNNILSVIIGYTDLLMEDLKPGEPMRAELDEILKAGHRAAGLTQQLLAFGRQQVLEPRLLDLDGVIEGIEKMLRRVLGEDINLHVRKSSDLRPVMADPGQVEQVLMNLVVNARDAMPHGGKLTIETGNVELDSTYASSRDVTPGPYTMIAVSDTGEGMNKETLARIFEPFFTTKEVGKGTGLGLSTVFGIVKQSQGSIWVYSEPGKGASFKVYLPSVAGSPVLTESVVSAPGYDGTETILLVEDDDAVRSVAATILKRSGYRILEARDPEEAQMICDTTSEPIELLLTDVVMPHLSGPALGKILAARMPGLKILCMSGYTDEAVIRHGLLESGIAFLQKPLSPVSLSRKVREVLDAPPHE
ncbi:MAG: response regulator [Planctomycetes bacterium]|nr:response regulator [Planctomycetota bacterium]